MKKSLLLSALQTNDSRTENGMVTHSTTLNNCVDLFFQIGAMRGQDKNRLINAFVKAFEENALTAMRLLFWARDIRGGAGERQIFRDIAGYLAKTRTETMSKNLHIVSEFGRWDDLLVFVNTPLETQALELLANAIREKNGLAAKWAPRENSSSRVRKQYAKKLAKVMGLSAGQYRKLVSEYSNTVEQLMCANKWSEIEYSKLPSKAMSDLMKTFTKHDKARFEKYLASLEKGEAGVKINAGAVYPYDITKNLRLGNPNGADAQWLALPNFLEGSTERLIPVVDVSGSMHCPAGNNQNVLCIDVAISLGLYICERNEGIFKDAFITFSERPNLQVVSGKLSERYNQMNRANWDMSTNIESVFRLILDSAVKNSVPVEDMPTSILILSDMEFNQGSSGYRNLTAQQMFAEMYEKAGYKLPNIIYWNIQSRSNTNKPVQFDEKGTCLVSGFSPAILSNVLGGKDMTPYNMMMSVIDSERYSVVTV